MTMSADYPAFAALGGGGDSSSPAPIEGLNGDSRGRLCVARRQIWAFPLA